MLLAACTGTIGPTDSAGSGSGRTGPVTGTGNSSTTGGPAGAFVPQASSLRRLTIPQYTNAIHDLLGPSIQVTTQFDDDIRFGGFVTIGVANVGVSSKMTEQFESTALDVARQALTNTAGRAALVGCSPASVADEVCTRSFLEKFGRRAWRRPLSQDELARYAYVAKNAQTVLNDFYGGLQYALAGLLQSPHFVYREEIGTVPDASNPARVSFSDAELATRLSFLLWNSTPDDALLTAADARELTQGGLVAQAQRLLSSDRFTAGVESFFSELYWLSDLDQLALNPMIYPQMSATLGNSMRTETLQFLKDIVLVRNGDVRDIFDSRSTFVNAELANVYGLAPVAAAAGFANVMLPDAGMRAGFLGQGSFLAMPSHSQPNRSSPTLRGKFVREMLLCQSVAPPPPVVPAFPDAIMGTAREKLEFHRSVPSCAACHAFMDPIGLGFENFDGVGAQRTQEFGKTIDASGDLDGVKFSGPRELMAAIRNHPDAVACIAKNAYRYAVAHVDDGGEQGIIGDVVKEFQDAGLHFRSLLEAVVKSPGFRYAAKPVN
jgi:hypothetical protein